MNAHTLKVLEYDAIRQRLAAHCATPMGAERVRQLTPSSDLETIRLRLQQTSEARRLIDLAEEMSFRGAQDVRSAVSLARAGGILPPEPLLSIADTLEAARRLRTFLLGREEKCPALCVLARQLEPLPDVVNEIRRCLREDATVADDATPELMRLRQRLRQLHSRITERLQAILHSSRVRNLLQEPVITLRGDRYCLPVKAEYRAQFGGIVHDVSASGATLFMEPQEVVDLGNQIRETQLAEQREVERVLAQLSALVGRHADALLLTCDALGELDFIHARALLSAEWDAVEPALNTAGRVRLRQARHPLLQPPVVPIDVQLGERFRILLITGPNTGGKTVTLKTVGLLTLMMQSGLHVPADTGTEMAVFEKVFADIGDEQSIEQSLSTFSGHITNIAAMLPHCDERTLVLLDELGAGTDPAEGAALAQAILDYLLARRARVMATTHYGELKSYAYARQGVQNASVEFDLQTLRPTYHLRIGAPGSSHAIVIAQRLGLPPSVIETARARLAGRETEAASIMRRLEEEQRAAERERVLAEQERRETENLRKQLQQRLEQLDEERQRLREQVAQEVQERLQQILQQAEEAYQRLREQPRENREAQEARQRIRQTAEQMRSLLSPPAPAPAPTEIREGDTVRVTTLNVVGTVLQLGEKEAVVQAGAIRVTVPREALRRVEGKPSAQPAVSMPVNLSRATGISPEIMLRMQRVEEALQNLDQYLHDAYAAGLEKVRVIHGKGTGALRQAVREYLRTHPLVASYRSADPFEGGDGVTVVTLR
ncbi:MAG: endonuclease MutS2 [Armatimonadota bacterium]|nr:endonuclease MutS2 [bacterium]MCS7310083.1 endonuclease MutS2 [Armatimonadota bacterium]MDW8105100.1 endonuclease MutS2 [Armatimonadota bacterium]MDW8290673.1 endonuclease MutS2 [Armatimonadota bacterium]